MTRRKPSEEERKLWRAAMRGVTPLRDWQETERSPAEKTVFRLQPRPQAQRNPTARPLLTDSTLVPGRFDAESERRLRSGRLTVEARLDLHGMSEAKAHEAVLAFLTAAIAAKRGLVLIITGKGSTGMGILKRNLARWLEAAPPSLRRRIRALRPADPHDGGDGALYVLLKRK